MWKQTACFRDGKRSGGFVRPPSSGEARDPAHRDTLLFGYVPQKSEFRISYAKWENELNQGLVAWHQLKLLLMNGFSSLEVITFFARFCYLY